MSREGKKNCRSGQEKAKLGKEEWRGQGGAWVRKAMHKAKESKEGQGEVGKVRK